MRIDAHQHFWRYQPARDTWITDEMSVLKRDYLPEDLLPSLQASGMDGSIVVQADQSESETQFLLELAGSNPFVTAVVGWVDLRAPNVADRLAYFRQFENLCGFRHIIQAEPDEHFMFQSVFRRGISALSAFDFTYDILIYPNQLPAALELVSAFPDTRFVLDHLAKPYIKAGKMEPWARHIRELAANPNVFCKLSGVVTEADWQGWKREHLKPYLDVVFEAFGSQRLMFGSDWPVCLLAARYAQVVQLISDYLKACSSMEKKAVFGGNASRFYLRRVLAHGS